MLTDNFFASNESRNPKVSRNTIPGVDKIKHCSLFTTADNLLKYKKINKLIIGL